MKFYCIMFFYILATALYFSYPSITHASSSSSFPSTTLRLLAERQILQWKDRKLKVVDEKWKQLEGERAIVGQDNGTGEDGEELVYHVDYHGVSTHPTPSPKHPRP